MSESFPLSPDSDWYDALVARYGDAVPAIENLRIRSGLQVHVAHLFEQLKDLGLLRHVDILSVVTRNAGFVVIDARYVDSLSEVEIAALDFALEGTRAYFAESCEHCGKLGEIIAKAGLEALLDDPDAVIGDRLLCHECYKSWCHRDD
jgi:hypothetical protein